MKRAFGLLFFSLAALAQDPVQNTPFQVMDGRNGIGIPCVGCSIYTYAAGTTTPLATYTDSTLGTPNTNPVLTGSGGYAVNGSTITGIWVGASCYKLVLKDAQAVTIWTQDHICDQGLVLKALLAGSSGAAQIGFQPTGGTVPITVAGALNSAFLYDSGFDTAAHACASSITVAVTKQALWNSLSTMTCSAPLWFPTGAGVAITPAANQAITVNQITCAPTQKCFDTSASGSSIAFAAPVSRFFPGWWGAVLASPGSTDSTAALQACINAAWASGSICHFPPGNGVYNTTGLTLPSVTLNDWKLVGIEGDGAIHDQQTNKYGSIINCTGSSDCIVGNLAVFSDASYIFRDFSLLGPGSSSGHGLNINATTAAPRVHISNISIQNFTGSGKYGLRLLGPENSNVSDVDSTGNYGCAYFGGGFNGNTISNFTCQQSTGPDGILVSNSTEVSWSGGVIQSNTHNGIRFNGAIAWTLVSAHLENNNTSSTSGDGAVVFDTTGTQANEYIKLIGGGLYTSADKILSTSDVSAATVFTRIDGLYDAPVGNPKIAFGSGVSNSKVIDMASDCTSVTDTGSGNIFSVGANQFSCVSGAPAQVFGSPVGFGGNAAPVTAVDIHAASGVQGIRVGDDTVAQSYGYMKPLFDGGGSRSCLGVVFNGGSAQDLFCLSASPLWIQMFGSLQLESLTFATLPSSGAAAFNGSIIYCSDCAIANPCAGSGSGAVAKRIAGAWVCN